MILLLDIISFIKQHGVDCHMQPPVKAAIDEFGPRIEKLATLEEACHQSLSFLASSKYLKDLPNTRAAAVLLSESSVAACPEGTIAIICDDPYRAFAFASQYWEKNIRSPMPASVHPTAVIDPGALVDKRAFIGPYCVIEKGAVIKADASLQAHVFVGENTVVDESTVIYANVSLYHGVKIGKHCVIHSGAIIGADGFGFAPGKEGWAKIAQLGGVVIEDNVEVGAATCIDRGALGNTVIETGVKIDNLVQIAHNVKLGERSVLAACSGVAGSAKLGKGCMIGGGAGVAGHLDIAPGTVLSAMSLLAKSTQPGDSYASAYVAVPVKEWKKNQINIRQLSKWHKRVQQLELEIESLKPITN